MHTQTAESAEVKFVQGRKLYQLTNGLYQDDTGKRFDISGDKLFEERRPGCWYWLRIAPAIPDLPDFKFPHEEF